MRAQILVGVIGSLCGTAGASASLVLLQQSGTMTVHGQLGTFTASAPPATPWFQTINAGAGGNIWFAQAFMVSQWSSSQITIYAEALVDPGTGTPRLTQSLTDISIRFRVNTATLVNVNFSAAPNDAGPGVPLNLFDMRVRDATSGEVLAQGDANTNLLLAPGDYAVEGVNQMGNLPENLALTEDGARMLSMQVTVVPSIGAGAVFAGGVAAGCRRRRRCG